LPPSGYSDIDHDDAGTVGEFVQRGVEGLCGEDPVVGSSNLRGK